MEIKRYFNYLWNIKNKPKYKHFLVLTNISCSIVFQHSYPWQKYLLATAIPIVGCSILGDELILSPFLYYYQLDMNLYKFHGQATLIVTEFKFGKCCTNLENIVQIWSTKSSRNICVCSLISCSGAWAKQWKVLNFNVLLKEPICLIGDQPLRKHWMVVFAANSPHKLPFFSPNVD